ncbi:creatininase family protein [Halocatena halophila]|uniref:creatininase family protein n=1 Tax=Halocatena halophila TaxID=2814576 RepID=UPI002ED301B4
MQFSETVRMESLTTTEIERALSDGVRTVIVGVGSIEQHGPQLPLSMDASYGDELSRRIALELGDALAAPVIRPGCSGHHMDFPGTISIPPETLMATIEGYCRSLDEHGFGEIVLVPTHGGNFAPIQTVVPELSRSIDASILPIADIDAHMEILCDEFSAAGIEYEQTVLHAGAIETAIMLAIDAGLVNTDAFEVGHEGDVPVSTLLSDGMAAITENGVLGDPHPATADAGELLLDRVTEEYAAMIEERRA